MELARFHHAFVISHVLLGQFGWKQIEVGLPDHLFDVRPHLFASQAIGVLDSPTSIFAEDAQRQALDQGMVDGLGVTKRDFDIPLIGDDAADTAHQRLVGITAIEDCRFTNPGHAAARIDEPVVVLGRSRIGQLL